MEQTLLRHLMQMIYNATVHALQNSKLQAAERDL